MEKILVIQTAFIGDAILALPMIQKLKDLYPYSTIDVISNTVTFEIFSASPYINEVIVLDKKNRHKSIFSVYKFAKKIKERNYTKLFSSHRSFRTSVIVLLSDIRETYGFDNSTLMHVYKYLIPYNYHSHEVQRNLDLIGFNYNQDNWTVIPELVTDLKQKEKVDIFIKENNLFDQIIAVAPGTIWNTKQYPLEYYEKVISAIIQMEYKVILIGGENDKLLCEKVSSANNNIISAAGYFSVPETIELLKKAKLILSNDSAPTHMGVCADIPVLTLYCSTSYKFGFYPYNRKSSYLSYDDLFCKPCGIHGYNKCPISTFECGKLLNPETVILKIKKMLND